MNENRSCIKSEIEVHFYSNHTQKQSLKWFTRFLGGDQNKRKFEDSSITRLNEMPIPIIIWIYWVRVMLVKNQNFKFTRMPYQLKHINWTLPIKEIHKITQRKAILNSMKKQNNYKIKKTTTIPPLFTNSSQTDPKGV